MTVLDVITMGRVCVDLYPEQSGVGLADVRSFRKSLGGSPTNVAVQASLLGSRSAVITKVGDDPFGGYVRGALEAMGVESRWVGTDPKLRTPLAFCEVHPPDRFPILFYREPSAPDLQLRPRDADPDAVCRAKVFWTTGTGLSAEPSRATTLGLLELRAGCGNGARPTTIHDLDHRPVLWECPAHAGEWARRALGMATVAVGNQDEVEMAVGVRDPAEAAERLLELGVELAIVKRGGEGVYARGRAFELELEPVRLEVLNGLGAGDSFGGTLAHGLATGAPVETTLRLANAAGAITASRLACADDFPTREEIEAVLVEA